MARVRTPSPAARSAIATVLTVAAIVTWCVLLRPAFLGGTTGYVLVAGTSMEPTMHTGDLAVIHRQDGYRVGDVIAFHVPRGEPGAGALVIHRIIGGSPTAGYRTQGDNRDRPDFWRPKPADVAGRTWFHVPGVGRALALLRQPLALGTLAGLLTFLSAGRRPPTPDP